MSKVSRLIKREYCEVCGAEVPVTMLREDGKCNYCYVSFEFKRPAQPVSSKSACNFFNVLEENLTRYFEGEKTFFNHINDHQQEKIEQLGTVINTQTTLINNYEEFIKFVISNEDQLNIPLETYRGLGGTKTQNLEHVLFKIIDKAKNLHSTR